MKYRVDMVYALNVTVEIEPDVYVEAGDCPFEGEVGKFEISCEELPDES